MKNLCLAYSPLDSAMFIGGGMGVSWPSMLLSFLIDTVADTLYSYFDLLGLYFEGRSWSPLYGHT